jgi:hypothetical protein
LVNELTASRPEKVTDILDPQTFESVNNWRDIGATRHGILEENEMVLCVFAETTTEQIVAKVPLGPFQLAAVWNTAEEDDEQMHLAFRHYPSVQIGQYKGQESAHPEAFPSPTVFVKFP